MSSQQRRLPLFPLNTVLFPNGWTPLQIFEERYKQMLKDCLSTDSRFGIVLIKSGSEVGEPAIPYSVGTVARIEQVSEAQSGRFLIGVVGEQRFEIVNIAQYRPYVAADVRLLEDDGGQVPASELEAARQSVSAYACLVEGLRGAWSSRPVLPRDPVALSYHAAEMLQVDLVEKQALLEQPSASHRLMAVQRLIERDTDTLRRKVILELTGRFSPQ